MIYPGYLVTIKRNLFIYNIFHSKHNYVLSIVHVATCFDSKSHQQANRLTITEVHRVTVHILGSKKVYKPDHY